MVCWFGSFWISGDLDEVEPWLGGFERDCDTPHPNGVAGFKRLMASRFELAALRAFVGVASSWFWLKRGLEWGGVLGTEDRAISPDFSCNGYLGVVLDTAGPFDDGPLPTGLCDCDLGYPVRD